MSKPSLGAHYQMYDEQPTVKARINPNVRPDGHRLVDVTIGDFDSSVRIVGDADRMLDLVHDLHAAVWKAVSEAGGPDVLMGRAVEPAPEVVRTSAEIERGPR